MMENKIDIETRQERREKKLRKKRERMPKHGQSLARIYMDAILKKLKRQPDKLR
jgi:TPP-dependent indolepyruvate ferredoxin oxidoreductase alpha subunit